MLLRGLVEVVVDPKGRRRKSERVGKKLCTCAVDGEEEEDFEEEEAAK